MTIFKSYVIEVNQELENILLKALLSLVKTESTAESIMLSATVIQRFNEARLKSSESIVDPQESLEVKSKSSKI